MDVPTALYTFMTITDTLSTLSAFPMTLSLFKKRDPAWFGYKSFCYAWGFLWTIIPFFSVFLVAVISITRTYILAFPLRRIKTRTVVTTVLMYFIYLTLSSGIPVAIKYETFIYTADAAYCWDIVDHTWYSKYHLIHGASLLVAPFIPIILSCIISIYYIVKSLSMTSSIKMIQKRKMRATTTVVIVTVVYAACNVPVCIIWVFYFMENVRVVNTFWAFYSWGVSYVVLVAVNAALNPFIYVFRMKRFRSFISCRQRNIRLNTVSYIPSMPNQDKIQKLSDILRNQHTSLSDSGNDYDSLTRKQGLEKIELNKMKRN